MTGARETNREMAVYDRLRDVGLGHTCMTLRILAAHALTEDRDDDRPKGWVAASNVWIQQRTGRSENTITGHVAALIKSGDLVVWAPARPRSGRPREYLITLIAGAQVVKRAEMRTYRRNHGPLRSKAQHPQYYPQSTTGDNPLNALGPNRAEFGESRETVTQQGPAPAVTASALVVRARKSGTKTTDSNIGDNVTPEPVEPAPSIAVPATRGRTWSELIADASTTLLQSQHKTGSRRGEHVGLGRQLDRVAIEQGPHEADAVLGRAVSRARRGEGLGTALRDELKIALGVDDWHAEQEFAATCADRTIPMTRHTHWPSKFDTTNEEHGT